jgi:hypothetical protein
MKRILDTGFQYRPSYETNIRRTFERVRRQLQQKASAAAAQESPKTPLKVVSLADTKKRPLLKADEAS